MSNPPSNPADNPSDNLPDNLADSPRPDGIPPAPEGGPAFDRSAGRRRSRIERISRRRHASQPRWSLEMFESPLMDHNIPYTVHDALSPEANESERGWIDFTRPTVMYRDACGDNKVLVRLTVDGGRLSITSPDCYPRGSLVRTTDPPIDREGTLRVARLGSDQEPQIDLLMAADGLVTAVMQMDTVPCPFTRRAIVAITDLFVTGVDLLDVIVRRHRLLIEHRERPDA